MARPSEDGGGMQSQKPRKLTRMLGAASWSSLALAGALSAVAAWQAGSHGGFASASLLPIPERAEPAEPALELLSPASEPAPAAVRPPIEVRVYTEGELRRGETIAAALDRQDVSAQLVHDIAAALRPVFDFRYARAGDRYRLAQNERGEIVEFEYRRSAWDAYTLRREGEALVPARVQPDLEVEQARVAGVISTNLYDAIDALGESGELAHDFA